MKPFVEVKNEHRYLFNIGLEDIKKKLILSAIELDLFSHLEDFTTSKSIAEKMSYDCDNTEHVLNALASIDLVDKRSGEYKNKDISSIYLSKNSDSFIGDYLVLFDLMKGTDIDISKAVKEGGKDLYKEKDGYDSYKLFGDFTAVIKKGQRVGRAKEICNIVTKLPEFKDFKKILDLGGGPGLIGIALGCEKDDIEGVIFDMPETITIADECIKEYKVEDRFSTIGGNYLTDDIGDGYDFVLACGTLNFAKDKLDVITKKIHNSLNENGVFMCISEGLVEEGTKPTDMVLGWLPSYLKGMNCHLNRGEVREVALRNGFISATRETIDSLIGILDVDILRK
jgi:hypothetical protein